MSPLAALALCALFTAPAFAATGQLHTDGEWIRDGRGRVILLRGLNYSGLEFGNVIGRPNGPVAEDFAQMASWGMNVIRLPVAWHYLEPQPGVFDRQFLRDNVDPIVQWARRNGMRVVLELHQFQWSRCVGGLGMPEWSCEGMGYSRDIAGAWAAQHDFWAGALAPDGVPLVERFLQVWERLAKHYRRSGTVVGFNFLNEPLDIQALQTFEHDTLYPFYREAIARVRAARARQMIVLEPPVTRNLGVPAMPEHVGVDDLLYAPHLYTVTGGLDTIPYDRDRAKIDADYALAVRESSVQGAILWPGEFGGAVDRFPDETTLFWHHTLDEMDERLIGGAGWAYFPGGNIFSVVTADGEEKPGVVDALVRPYPMETAGIPVEIHWDRSATGAFVYRFAEDTSRRVADPTVIFVPERHFPNGFTVETTPGDVAIVQPDRQRVLIRRDRTVALHSIMIRPVAPPLISATAGAAAGSTGPRAGVR